MKQLQYLASAAVLTAMAAFSVSARAAADTTTAANAPAQSFAVGEGTFLLDGKPFVVKAAELHYPRIPKPYWEHRIKMCKALGMNTICLYVFWNFHEQKPGEYDFTGQRDIREFIELCAANDMKVILRPGPYVCAEWEMGGLPWWLLKDNDIRLREQDPRFVGRVDDFMGKVAEQTAGLLDADGGPVIMIQVENEYGSYGKDKPYVSAVRDIVRKHFGNDVALFQCDWSSNFLDNGLDDLLWTMNFGTGADIDSQFAELRKVRPSSPLMCSEFWSGWFDKWGARHETRPADDMIAGIGEMLSKGISFSLYMTHGGTNWGHWAGANSPGYAPDVTSYDYDAPINENGAVTPKYDMLRELLAKYNDGKPLPDVPAPIPVVEVAPFTFDAVAPLWSNLPEARHDSVVRPMEHYDQGFGSVIYSTTLPKNGDDVTLVVDEPHDYALVYVDGSKKGTLDRRNGDRELRLGKVDAGSRLDILVEATGRINFGRAIKDYKGISRDVEFVYGPDTLRSSQWDVTLLPDEQEFYKAQHFYPVGAFNPENGDRLPAGVYTTTFNVDSVGDTFLDMSAWGKGLVYVNGHDIGRFWEIGPQQTLYMPGCWLREGENEILVFDILGPKEAVVAGLSRPLLDDLKTDTDAAAAAADTHLPDLSQLKLTIDTVFKPVGGWQTVEAATPQKGRYVALEIVSASDGGDDTAIAELNLIDGDGNLIPREDWRIVAVDSEDKDGGNHTGEKAFDRQESTFWRNAPGALLPHVVVIDMGKEYVVSGMQYLPRMESGAPQSVGRCRVYVDSRKL